MSRDRSNGMGSIYKRKSDGRWVAAMKLPNGKRKVFYGRREADVVEQLKKAHAALDSGTLVTARRQTVKAFLETWLEQSVRPRVRPSTFQSYELDVRLHL